MGCGASSSRVDFTYPESRNGDQSSEETCYIITKLLDSQPTRDDLRPFNHQTFVKLKAWCEHTGQQFVDPEFFPQDKSVFLQERVSSSDVVWLRPGEICRNPKLYLEGASTLEFDEISTEPTSFMTACFCLASYPHIIKQMIPDIESQEWHPSHQYNGIFHFILYSFGEWVDVVVDDYLPTCRGRLIYCRQTSRNEFWAALLEKAYAKTLGNYELLQHRSVINILEDLTGAYTNTRTIPRGLSAWKKDYSIRKFILDLMRAHQQQSLIITSLTDKPATIERLSPGTTLVLNQIQWIPFEGRLEGFSDMVIPMIRLLNPWGHTEETGPWFLQSKQWNSLDPQARDDIGIYLENDGEFWLTFSDMESYFEEITVIDSLQDPDDTPYRFCFQAKGPLLRQDCLSDSQFLLQVEDTTELVICFNIKDQPEHRIDKTCISLYQGNSSEGYRIKSGNHIAIQTTCSEYGKNCCMLCGLEIGFYVIQLHVQEDFPPAHIESAKNPPEFLLRVYSDSHIHLSSELGDSESVMQTVPLGPSEPRGVSSGEKRGDTVDLDVCVHFCEGLQEQGNEPLELYCIVVCGDDIYGSDFEETLNPVWDFSVVIYGQPRILSNTITVEVRNRAADDKLIGMAEVTVSHLRKITPERILRHSKLQASYEDKNFVPGTLCYSISISKSASM